jgi:hypothetical protein
MFRITSAVRIAIEQVEGALEDEISSVMSLRPVSDRARISVSRVPRNDPLFREVATALLDAVATLEGEVERLRNVIELKDRGITLQQEVITIGGDGMYIPKVLPFSNGDYVRIYLELDQRGIQRMISLIGIVDLRPNGTELKLSHISTEMRDLIVGYVFQQQGKERRHARNADSTD